MKSKAYLSKFFCLWRDRSIFPISLMVYDDIFVDIDLSSIPWEEFSMFKGISTGTIDTSRKPNLPSENLNSNEISTWGIPEFAFASYLDCDHDLYIMLRNNFHDIRAVSERKISSFFEPSTHPPLNNFGIPEDYALFIDWLGMNLENFYPDYLPRYPVFIKYFLSIISQELLVTEFLSRNTDITPILSSTEYLVRAYIREAFPDITIQGKNSSRGPIMKLISQIRESPTRLDDIQLDHQKLQPILELAVPNFKEIPIHEIVQLKKKDKFVSIGRLVQDISLNKSGSQIDVAYALVDQLWKMGNLLAPSLPETVIGILSNIPIPFLSESLGLMSTAKGLSTYLKFRRNYEWFIILSKLGDNN